MSSSVDLASLVAQAREALAARRLDSAIEAAGRALKVEPRCVDAYLMRAEAYRRTDKYERALADLAVAVRLAPDRPGPYIVRAEILMRRNVFDQAIADATHALILDPLNASAFSIRAQCRHALGDREGAADDVRAMLDVDPTRAVPDLPAVASPSSPAAILDERFWKEPGDGRRHDDPTLFADGRWTGRTALAGRSPTRPPPRSWGPPAGTGPRSSSHPSPGPGRCGDGRCPAMEGWRRSPSESCSGPQESSGRSTGLPRRASPQRRRSLQVRPTQG